MAQGNNFLTLPKQDGLFIAIRSERSGEDRDRDRSDSPPENENEEDEEENEENVRLIPRSSPVPRKRGHSLTDETAEYMRIRFSLPRRRVSFADASGGELVDVREFVPFDSDEEDNDRWEEEEAKYRKAYRKPVYRLQPDFQPLTCTDLVLSVHKNKVEVESVSPVPDEPLMFESVIRVLNISFHKSVYVRSTMDGWITHFDYPAEYVQDSHDGETDKFSVRLSFAEPYLFNGARIDFVVRYATSDEEFWANNSGRNYSVTLFQSYEEDAEQSCKMESVDIRGILKPPRFRMEDDYDFPLDDEGEGASTEREADVHLPSPSRPVVIEPEIDIEITEASPVQLPEITEDPSQAERTRPGIDVLYDENPQDLSENPPLTPDHPEITESATESLVSTQQLGEISDHEQSSHSDLPHQVPSDLHPKLLAMIPVIPHMEEEERSGNPPKMFDLKVPKIPHSKPRQEPCSEPKALEDLISIKVNALNVETPVLTTTVLDSTVGTEAESPQGLEKAPSKTKEELINREEYRLPHDEPVPKALEALDLGEVDTLKLVTPTLMTMSPNSTTGTEAGPLQGIERAPSKTEEELVNHKDYQLPHVEPLPKASETLVSIKVDALKVETPALTTTSSDSTTSTEARSPQGLERAPSKTVEELVNRGEYPLPHDAPLLKTLEALVSVEVDTLKMETSVLTTTCPDSKTSTEADLPQILKSAFSKTEEELVIHEEYQLPHDEPFPKALEAFVSVEVDTIKLVTPMLMTPSPDSRTGTEAGSPQILGRTTSQTEGELVHREEYQLSQDEPFLKALEGFALVEVDPLKVETPTLMTPSLDSRTAIGAGLPQIPERASSKTGEAIHEQYPRLPQDEPLSSSQEQVDHENQLPLPNEASEAFSASSDSAKSEVMLGKTLVPSIAFLSAAVFLAVGFQDPSVFLVIGLFLFCLCF